MPFSTTDVPSTVSPSAKVTVPPSPAVTVAVSVTGWLIAGSSGSIASSVDVSVSTSSEPVDVRP